MSYATLLCFSAGGNTFSSQIPRNQRSLQSEKRRNECAEQKKWNQKDQKEQTCTSGKEGKYLFKKKREEKVKWRAISNSTNCFCLGQDTKLFPFLDRSVQIPPDYISSHLFSLQIFYKSSTDWFPDLTYSTWCACSTFTGEKIPSKCFYSIVEVSHLLQGGASHHAALHKTHTQCSWHLFWISVASLLLFSVWLCKAGIFVCVRDCVVGQQSSNTVWVWAECFIRSYSSQLLLCMFVRVCVWCIYLAVLFVCLFVCGCCYGFRRHSHTN